MTLPFAFVYIQGLHQVLSPALRKSANQAHRAPQKAVSPDKRGKHKQTDVWSRPISRFHRRAPSPPVAGLGRQQSGLHWMIPEKEFKVGYEAGEGIKEPAKAFEAGKKRADVEAERD